jgi:hypothetical protein
MADNDKEKQATCPVCGYTDTSTDAAALADAMQQHMRSAHNMDWSPGNTDLDIKQTGRDVRDPDDAPFIPVPGEIPEVRPNYRTE